MPLLCGAVPDEKSCVGSLAAEEALPPRWPSFLPSRFCPIVRFRLPIFYVGLVGPMTVSALSRGPSAFELSSRQEGHARHRRRSKERDAKDEGNGYPPFYTSCCSSFKKTLPSLSLGICVFTICFVSIRTCVDLACGRALRLR